MRLNFCGGIAVLKVGGQGADGLEFGEFARDTVVREPCQSGVELVNDVGKIASGCERQMAWAGTEFERGECGIVWDEGALDGIEFVDQDFVESEIGCVGESVISRQVDGMSVGLFLAIRVGAGALMLDESCLRKEFHGGIEGKDCHATSAVIRTEHILSFSVHDQVTGSVADCGFLVDESEEAGLGIDRITRNGSSSFAFEISNFVGGEKSRVIGMDREKGGVRCGGRKDGRGEIPRFYVEFGNIDAFATLIGISAKINPVSTGRSSSRESLEHGDGRDDGSENPRMGGKIHGLMEPKGTRNIKRDLIWGVPRNKDLTADCADFMDGVLDFFIRAIRVIRGHYSVLRLDGFSKTA